MITTHLHKWVIIQCWFIIWENIVLIWKIKQAINCFIILITNMFHELLFQTNVCQTNVNLWEIKRNVTRKKADKGMEWFVVQIMKYIRSWNKKKNQNIAVKEWDCTYLKQKDIAKYLKMKEGRRKAGEEISIFSIPSDSFWFSRIWEFLHLHFILLGYYILSLLEREFASPFSL